MAVGANCAMRMCLRISWHKRDACARRGKKLTELLHLNDEIENNSFIFAMVQKNSHQHQTYPVNADGLKKQKTYMRNKIVPAGNRRDLFFS